MTHFYTGLFHNSKRKKKHTFIGNRSRDFQYDVGKKYAPNRANWVQKFKISLRKGVCPLATPARGLCSLDPHQGASPLEPPSLVNNLGPPFPAAGSAPDKILGIWKGALGLFLTRVKAMEWQPYWPSHMEVSYCTFGFGAIIQRDLHKLSLPCVSLCDYLCACMI